MATHHSPEEIRRRAKELDDAVEEEDVEKVLSFFSDDCEVRFGGVTLRGKDGLRRGLAWLYDRLGTVKFELVTILVEGNTLFEEFLMKTQKQPDAEFQTAAAEVLVYQDGRVTSLRLYFDRLALAHALAKGVVEKWIVKKLDRISLGDLKGKGVERTPRPGGRPG
jgi:ketosteroid isomerase-like protein